VTQISWFLVMLVGLSIAGCGGLIGADASLSSTSSSGESTTSSSSPEALAGLTSFSVNSDNDAVVQLDNIDTSSNYILALYSYNTSNSSYSLSVTSPDVSSTVTTSALTLSNNDSDDETENAHALLRDMEADLDGDVVSVPATRMKAVTTALTVGSTRTFKVLQSFSSTTSYQTVTATLEYVSSNFYVYIDNRDLMSDADMVTLSEKLADFDAVVATERTLFGEESDVNGDGHFAILMTQGVNELAASQGAGVIVSGFYFGGDLYSASSTPSSNEMEVLYSLVPDPTGAHGTVVSTSFAFSNFIPSLLPHEFQHMISYNQHVLINHGSAETSFLGEAMSHLAEDIYSTEDGYMTSSGIENPSRMALYLNSTSSVCFICGSSITQRGGSYSFIRYLYEQAEKGNLAGASSGAELISRLLDTNLTGTSNFLNAATGSTDAAGFSSLMAHFSAALYLSGLDLVSDDHYTLDGIDLRGKQSDNRGTTLSGPSVTEVSTLPYNLTLVSAGVTYLQISGQSLEDVNGLVSVHFPSGMQGGGAIIQMN